MSVVYTVGYEGSDIERFIETLAIVGIARVADVRAVPISRKKGFSKSKLAERLRAAGIEYQHFSELGDPKPGREAAKAKKYDLFRRIYNTHLSTDAAQEDLAELKQVVDIEPTVLLCFERDPSTCHRSIVAQEIKDDLGLVIQNLFADDPDRYVRNAEKLPSYYSRKSAAAAE